jgi:hypothetical protein
MHTPYGHWIGYAEFSPTGGMIARHEYAHTIMNQMFLHAPWR